MGFLRSAGHARASGKVQIAETGRPVADAHPAKTAIKQTLTVAEERKKRLAEALRKNLHLRKARARTDKDKPDEPDVTLGDRPDKTAP
jgi:antitoxin (DNA-binding transcriptional repressor) of toxin-antitoxin stability system